MRWWWLGIVGLVSGAACAPTYAPPVRTTHGGAPGRAEPGQAAAAVRATVPGAVSPGLDVPLGGRASLELGGDFAPTWALGTFGVRLAGLPHPLGGDVRLSPELDFGFGIGRGGERCGNEAREHDNCDGDAVSDGLRWHQRLAGGGWVGGGVGLHLYGGFSVFARGAMRLSGATGVPTTFWISGLGGLDQRIGPLSLYLGAGWYGYTNSVDANDGLFLEAGLAARFGGDD